jgi:hypothetical protein
MFSDISQDGSSKSSRIHHILPISSGFLVRFYRLHAALGVFYLLLFIAIIYITCWELIGHLQVYILGSTVAGTSTKLKSTRDSSSCIERYTAAGTNINLKSTRGGNSCLYD